ncbi:MAG: TonB-dependent receptor [Desulfosalsimonadaceae bacterium]
MAKKVLLVCWVLCLCAAVQSAAQTQKAESDRAVTRMDDMVVTSERFPVLEKESPQFIQSFSGRELERTGANNVIDALRRIGGFSYKAYAPLGIKAGMESHVSIRGVEDGELILINGMPIQNAGNQNYQLYNLPIENIERIEVIKGASSTQYGADAMSGVINIITRKNTAGKKVGASVEFGDYRYHNHSAYYYGPGLNLGVNYQHLDALREIQIDYEDSERNDSQEMHRYSLNLNANIAENLYFDMVGSFVESGYAVYDLASGEIKDSDDQEQYEVFTDLRYQAENLQIKTFFKYGDEESKEYEYEPQKVLDEVDENTHFNTGISTDYRFDLLTADFKTGLDYVHRAADFESRYGYHYRNDYAVFAIISREFFDRLKVNLGMREQLIEADSDGEDHDKFTPSLGLNYKASPSLNLFANAAEAFRAPSFNNLYYDSWLIQGNPDLDPEEGWTYDVGFKWTNLWSKLRLSGFYMDYDDKIESYNPSGGYPYIYFNAGAYESVGMDWDIELFPFFRMENWSRHLCFYTTGTWCDPTAEEPDGTEYQTGPRLSASFGVEYETQPFIFAVNTNYVTSRPDELDTISTVDVSGKYRLWKGYLTMAVDNVFDEDVEINGNKETDNYIYYGMPRFFKIGYEIAF